MTQQVIKISSFSRNITPHCWWSSLITLALSPDSVLLKFWLRFHFMLAATSWTQSTNLVKASPEAKAALTWWESFSRRTDRLVKESGDEGITADCSWKLSSDPHNNKSNTLEPFYCCSVLSLGWHLSDPDAAVRPLSRYTHTDTLCGVWSFKQTPS